MQNAKSIYQYRFTTIKFLISETLEEIWQIRKMAIKDPNLRNTRKGPGK